MASAVSGLRFTFLGFMVLRGSGVFFFVVAPPGLFRPDVVHQTFFAIA